MGKSSEGWLLTDNRASGGLKLELPTITCVHCNCVVVLNPERRRERNWCRKCDAYVCDRIGCVQECNNIQRDLANAMAGKPGPHFLRSRDGWPLMTIVNPAGQPMWVPRKDMR